MLKKYNVLALLAITCAVVVMVAASYALPPEQGRSQPVSVEQGRSQPVSVEQGRSQPVSVVPVVPSRWTSINPKWTEEAWTGHDFFFKNARLFIDAEKKAGKLTPAIIQRYKAKALSKKLDPLAQYKWAYAAYTAGGQEISFGSPVLRVINFALAKPAPTHSYEYNRLRFVLMYTWLEFPQLKQVAKRLLKHNADDYDVETDYIGILDSGDKSDRQEALAYALKLVTTYPKQANSYSTLAFVYDTSWLYTNSTSDADGAVLNFDKYLALLPTTPQNAHSIFGIKHIINVIQRYETQK